MALSIKDICDAAADLGFKLTFSGTVTKVSKGCIHVRAQTDAVMEINMGSLPKGVQTHVGDHMTIYFGEKGEIESITIKK